MLEVRKSKPKTNFMPVNIMGMGFSKDTNNMANTTMSSMASMLPATANKKLPVLKKMNSTNNMLLKQSEATTIDPYMQHLSKKGTPVSSRRGAFVNGGTMISKESSGEENKSNDVSPLIKYNGGKLE